MRHEVQEPVRAGVRAAGDDVADDPAGVRAGVGVRGDQDLRVGQGRRSRSSATCATLI